MRECPVSGKHRYKDMYDAHHSADREMLKPGCPALAVYRCPWCNDWHLTKNKHPMKRVMRMLRAQERRRAEYANNVESK